MVKQFNSITEAIKHLQKQIANSNVNNSHLKDEVAETMREVIQDNVYAAFTPEEYKRREDDGGFSDTDNMVFTDVQTSGNTVNLTFENITEGNDSMSGKRLDGLFENGNGVWDKVVVDDQGRVNTEPREFIEDTVNELNRKKDKLLNATKKDLKSKGFNVK